MGCTRSQAYFFCSVAAEEVSYFTVRRAPQAHKRTPCYRQKHGIGSTAWDLCSRCLEPKRHVSALETNGQWVVRGFRWLLADHGLFCLVSLVSAPDPRAYCFSGLIFPTAGGALAVCEWPSSASFGHGAASGNQARARMCMGVDMTVRRHREIVKYGTHPSHARELP